MNSHIERARELLKKTELVFSTEQVQAAVAKVANELNERFNYVESDTFPLFLGVMGGSVVFTGQLLPQLTFPMEFDFLHVSSYGTDDHGNEVIWKVIPRRNVMNRVIVVLDDVLDDGETLFQVQKRLIEMGAAKVILVVLGEKHTGTKKQVLVDHVGMPLPNKFLVGFGLDVEGYWRNLPDIRSITPAAD